MGWFAQGYIREYDYNISPPKYLSSKWVTGNNICENDAINKYDGYEVQFDNINYNLEIFYGPSALPYFRGYLKAISGKAIEAKRLLSKFNNLPVYKTKHGQEQKKFHVDKLVFVELPEVVLFYEILKEWDETNWSILKNEFHSLIYSERAPKIKAAIDKLEPRYW